MPQNRRLSLKREALAELSTDELTVVNGAADVATVHPLFCYVVGASQLRCEQLTLTNCITCSQ